MSTQLVFDNEAGQQLEAVYRTADAVRRRSIVRAALAAAPGERILDVGCGPGFYCAELLEDVGPSGSVIGVDSAPAMLALAERRCTGLGNVELLAGEATALPVDDGDFDAAISVQVQEYVPEIATGLAELHRALRPGGRAVVFDIDWETLSIHSRAPELTARVLRAWDEHLAHRSLPRTLAPRLRAAGFDDVRMSAHPFATAGSGQDSYAATIAPLIAAFVSGRQGVGEGEAQAWLEDQRELRERGELFFTLTQFCFTARKPG
jgi:ubiquinone/menaquinone biosynthesis C-methylase UbiE